MIMFNHLDLFFCRFSWLSPHPVDSLELVNHQCLGLFVWTCISDRKRSKIKLQNITQLNPPRNIGLIWPPNQTNQSLTKIFIIDFIAELGNWTRSLEDLFALKYLWTQGGLLVHWWQVRTNWFPGAFARNPRLDFTFTRTPSAPGLWTLPPSGPQVSPEVFPQLYHICPPLDHCKQTDEHSLLTAK